MPKGQKGINKMKKNIFKKIVASLATVAMAAGLFTAMPAEEAKAAADGKETEIVIVLSEKVDVDHIYLDIYDGANSQNANISSTAAKDSTNVGWGRDMHVFTKDAKNELMYSVTTTGSLGTDEYCNMQFIFEKGGSMVKGYKFYSQNQKDLFNNSSKIYVSIDVTKGDWSDFSATEKDPTIPDAAGVVTAINAIGTVELTDACKSKIEAAELAYNNHIKAGGLKADVTNYDKLTAARAAYDKLVADENAKAAGTLTVYVKSPGWTSMNVYGWDGAEFGNWPGKTLTPLTKNKGWFSVSFDITQKTNLIFNDSKKDGAEQTVDWKGVEAGTYWLVLKEKGEDGKYTVDNVSTKAPTGWQDEAAEKVENKAPVKTTTTTDKGSVATKDDVAKIDKEAVVVGAPEGAKLDATEIAADSDAFKVVKEAAKTAFKNKAYVALDLKLLKGTEAVQPNGDVKVTIPVPSALAKAKKVAVYRVGDDNKLVSCGTADVANGKLTFTTNHFSTYVFADATPATNTGDAAPIVFMLAVAAVAASMVIASKKKTICE